jgi:PAS domain-containing protein
MHKSIDSEKSGKIDRLKEDEVTPSRQGFNALGISEIDLATILAKTPLFIMVVDQERRVHKVSDAVLDFTGLREEEILGLRGGEALRCAYHLDDPMGCGFGTECKNCKVRNTVIDTLTTGNDHKKVEATLSFLNDEVEQRALLISTTVLDHPDKRVIVFIEDITERKKAEEERELLIKELKEAINEIKTLRGILPICSFCKKIRNDKGYWEQVDIYLHRYSEADVSHSVCPECMNKHYPDVGSE